MYSFLVKDGVIYDPTMGAYDAEYYAWEVVNKEVWENFPYKEKDKLYDYREYVSWITNQFTHLRM